MTDETTERKDEAAVATAAAASAEAASAAGDQSERLLVEARNRVAELEQALTGREREIAELKQCREGLETRVADLGRSVTETVAGYRALVIEANPGIPAELIGGENVAAIGESLKRAQALVKQVRQGLEEDASLARFPAGSPERTMPGGYLSPREKIQQAISSPHR